jgi:hypothetical protein
VFVVRNGKLSVGGMLVRANSTRGHFIAGDDLKWTVARNVAKNSTIVDRVLSLLEAGLVDGRLARDDSPGAEIIKRIGGMLSGAFDGDEGRVRKTLQDWPTSGKSLAVLAVERAGKEIMERYGDDAVKMWAQIKGDGANAQ